MLPGNSAEEDFLGLGHRSSWTGNGSARRQYLMINGCELRMQPYFWVNYNDLTATSLEIMVSKGNHLQMALIQVSELL